MLLLVAIHGAQLTLQAPAIGIETPGRAIHITVGRVAPGVLLAAIVERLDVHHATAFVATSIAPFVGRVQNGIANPLVRVIGGATLRTIARVKRALPVNIQVHK